MLLVFQLVALLTLAACPDLHHALHPDSNCLDHHCLVTMFAKGQLSGPEVAPVTAIVVVFVICAMRLPDSPPRLRFQYRFAPTRVPPRR